ncbi:MAG: acetoin utilization protein AcuC [Anaerolineae bacterium]|nr:acetoin utilization protein AcuC [Anaerolineae bacterium]
MNREQQQDTAPRRAIFISSPDLWRHGFGGKHPLKPERLARTVALLEGYDAFAADNATIVEPRPATDEELARFHTHEYIQIVKALSDGNLPNVPARRHGFGAGDNPVFKGMDKVSRLKAGGGLVGAEMLLSGACHVAFNFSGGLHHAMPSKASGFCIYNDIAVTIAWLLTQGRRVAYVDIDAHHGDGVQAAFEDTDQVLTISLHQDGHTLFPGTGFVDETGRGAGEGTSVNVPLYPQTDDETYLWAFREVVPPLVRRFAPDVLVSQLGVDTHYTDPLTYMGLTTAGHEALFQEFAALTPGKWFACGGGGYNLDVVPRSWTLAFGVMSEQAFPDELPQSYRDQYGGQWLHDRDPAPIDRATRDRARRRAEEVVAAVKDRFEI